MKQYYTMIFDIRDSKLFSSVMAPYLEGMCREPLNGARLTCVAHGHISHELDEMGKYSDYLNSYIDSNRRFATSQWSFLEWSQNGNPETFDEEDHTDESYDEG